MTYETTKKFLELVRIEKLVFHLFHQTCCTTTGYTKRLCSSQIPIRPGHKAIAELRDEVRKITENADQLDKLLKEDRLSKLLAFAVY